ncbi:hypothetical protein Scep_022824 [Stephania cephalantha]|uniref:O-methyltransferase dimerisation domain-containing protein n=1 Tax=Stephania cephalantha TaxID=152367 RepID=A0AAP0F8N3_9MAGN
MGNNNVFHGLLESIKVKLLLVKKQKEILCLVGRVNLKTRKNKSTLTMRQRYCDVGDEDFIEDMVVFGDVELVIEVISQSTSPRVLGTVDDDGLMEDKFAELGMEEKDCMDVSWIDNANDEDYYFAKGLVNACLLPMVMRAAIKLNVFEIMNKASNTPLSSSHIASQLPNNKNPNAQLVLDRMLCFLASHSVLTCTTATNKKKTIVVAMSTVPLKSKGCMA